MKITLKQSISVGLIAMFCLFSSCSLFLPSDDFDKSSELEISFSDSQWTKIDPDKSDHAFMNDKSGSILIINSTCKKYETSSFEHLTSDLLSGLESIVYEKKDDINVFGRKGVKIQANASLDGVLTYFSILTFKKNRCLYDFALISPSKNDRERWKVTFDKFIATSKFN